MFSLFLHNQKLIMSKCQHCIAKQFNSMNSLTKEELKHVSDCKKDKSYKKGDVIFNEGTILNGVYCVRSGFCKLTKLNANGNDQTVKLLGVGDIIGQRSIISSEKTNLSAIALNDIELCFVPKEEIINGLQNNRDFSLDVLQHLAYDLKEAEDDLVNMAQKSVKQRLSETLLYLHDHFGTDQDGFLSVMLSREDYANIVGTATESAIRILSQFKKDGYISTSGKHIEIVDYDGLKELNTI